MFFFFKFLFLLDRGYMYLDGYVGFVKKNIYRVLNTYLTSHKHVCACVCVCVWGWVWGGGGVWECRFCVDKSLTSSFQQQVLFVPSTQSQNGKMTIC